ncbi:hypothetical protein M9458_045456, partial [Cirrhinus mrigala]
AIGGRAYALLRSLTAPVKPADVSFENIVKTMQDHLAPKPLLIAERFRFHKRNQNEGESISAYTAELYKVQKKKSKNVHVIAQNSDEESDTGLANLEIYSLKSDLKQAIWLTPQINGKIIRMELDTGSAV